MNPVPYFFCFAILIRLCVQYTLFINSIEDHKATDLQPFQANTTFNETSAEADVISINKNALQISSVIAVATASVVILLAIWVVCIQIQLRKIESRLKTVHTEFKMVPLSEKRIYRLQDDEESL
jgi:hypothetical protein